MASTWDSSGLGLQDSTRVWVTRLDVARFRELPGTEGVTSFAWSPDSTAVAFIADGSIQRVDLSGSSPKRLGDAPAGGSGTAWGPDGWILLGATAGSGPSPLRRVIGSGGTVEPGTTLDTRREENSHCYPVFLPDGPFMYWALSSASEEQSLRYCA